MGRLLSGIPWIFGILLIVNSELAHGQRRTSRLTSTRTFGINAKSNPGSEFDCPEEFGYYPHPTDCSQYYVCVFGGALLESCTGGLMYSHELQTCDWPRNVGCEVVDGSSSQQQQQSIIPTQAAREVAPRIQQIQSQQQLQQQQPSLQQQPIQQSTIAPQRIRFSQPISTSAPQQLQQPSVQQPQPPSQRILARQQSIQSIPQPEFPAPNPIITSRGQPKSYFDAQEDIAKLYAEAHDTLPPAEEEETDRQQRVYRGQPSTLGQVQRDRDGIIHHSNVNALPTHGKIGSFAFGSAITPYSTTQQPSNIFVQQPQRQKPVAEPQNTRNFYNTSNHQSYDSGSYDSFYSVYDDDVDLYRDVEYTNQQQSQQQQQQNQQQHQQQTPYNTQRGRPQPTAQSTYRPEIITTPTPQVPLRETYSNKQQSDVHQSHQQQQQSSGSYDQPSLTYNSEYDDALISQISDDQTYNNQPTRNPVRSTQESSTNNQNDSESIVLTLTASANAAGSRNRPLTQNLTNNVTNIIGTRTVTVTTTTSRFQQQPVSETPRPFELPSRMRNVQILNDIPVPDQLVSQTTHSRQSDSPTVTHMPQNQTDIDYRTKKISLSLSSGFSTIDSRSIQSHDSSTAARKQLFGFAVSTNEPQGFRLPSQESSAERESSAITIPLESLENGGKSYKFSLSSGLGLQSKAATSNKGTVEEVPFPIYSRAREENLKRETTKIKVDPTTYSPARNWRKIRTSPSPFSIQETNHLSEISENLETDSYFPGRKAGLADKDDAEPREEIERFQGFTTRALIFKDNLSKNYETTSLPKFVSPFKSLETILAEKEEERSKGRFELTTPQPEQTTTSPKPFRSYFIITQPPKPSTSTTISTTTTEPTTSISPTTTSTTSSTTTTTTTSTTESPTTVVTERQQLISSTINFRPSVKSERQGPNYRGRSRYTFSYTDNYVDSDEPTTYSPRHRFSTANYFRTTAQPDVIRRRPLRPRPTGSFRGFTSQTSTIGGKTRFEFAALRAEEPERIDQNSYKVEAEPTPEYGSEVKVDSKIDDIQETSTTENPIVEITERPSQYFSSYRQVTTENQLAESIQNWNTQNLDSQKFRGTIEMPEFHLPTQEELDVAQETNEAQDEPNDRFQGPLVDSANIRTNGSELEYYYQIETELPPNHRPIYIQQSTTTSTTTESSTTESTTTATTEPPPPPVSPSARITTTTTEFIPPSIETETPIITTTTTTTTTTLRPITRKPTTQTNTKTSLLAPRASRVNNAIKSSIAASSRKKVPSSSSSSGAAISANGAYVKCADHASSAKCNEIPSRTRNRGGVHYTAGSGDRDPSSVPATVNRGTHPPRTRPTLKSKGSIVSKAAEFVDIYKNPPSRPEPLYPQPTPDKTAAKCRKDVCLLPDCSCGGKETPVGDMPFESIPQIVLLTFDDSVNDLNKQLYSDLFEKGRVNPNGCPITATFYVSHEWTDYSQVQNLYSDGHEIASHTVSHSFGEQFSQKKWTREIAGQREILSAYGGVKLSDVRGMRAPFLSIGGNKMFKMLYDSNFTYDSSMPVYENRPPSWPYTLDYKIFHDCMIPPCPTKSYPGVWEVPMVMWQDLNGGRCSMGDACANPPDSEGVTKMLMKNFDRHYTTNRAPFGLFYHAAWFTQPHHKEGFIKFLDTINAMDDVWIVTNWQALQWVRDPTPLSRIKQFQPFQCDYSDRPKRCNNPKVCNLWHKSGVRYMRTCQPCPDIYPWTGKTGIRSSRIDNEIDE